MKKYILVLVYSLWSMVYGLSTALADRGMIPITAPDVSIYEPGQKAIIGWNGNEEIMILAVDAYADAECKVLEILPLPSEPEIEEGNFESFRQVQRLIRKHAPRIRSLHKGRLLAPPSAGVEILFHKKIGPHNITCVKALKYKEFTDWAIDFIQREAIDTVQFPSALSYIIEGYLDNNIKYFVFDIIELSDKTMSVVPIIYKFKSPYLFFPLSISRLAKGDTRIQLFLLTEHMPWTPAIEPFRAGTYIGTGEEIRFKLNSKELKSIDPRLARLLSREVWLTAVEFEGPIYRLVTDLMLRKFYKIIEY